MEAEVEEGAALRFGSGRLGNLPAPLSRHGQPQHTPAQTSKSSAISSKPESMYGRVLDGTSGWWVPGLEDRWWGAMMRGSG